MKKKHEFTPVEQALLAHNIIAIKGDIDMDTFNYVREAFMVLEMKEAREATIRLSSGGGSEKWGLAIYDLIIYYSEKIACTGIAMGTCDSMASVILQACAHRLALKNATIMSHFPDEVRVPVMDFIDTPKCIEHAADAQAHRKMFLAVYKRSGKTESEIDAFLRKADTLFAPKALEWGLIDRIIERESEAKPQPKDEGVTKKD